MSLTGPALRTAVRDAVAKVLDLAQYEVFLFGSEATGTAGRRSDVDIGLLGRSPLEGHVLQRVRRELETLRTLRTFDVVDFSTVDESFRREALKHAERL